MIVRHFNEIEQSSRAVHAQNWSSFRLLTRDDGMGFSLHESKRPADSPLFRHRPQRQQLIKATFWPRG
jgi:hypothetical protein